MLLQSDPSSITEWWNVFICCIHYLYCVGISTTITLTIILKERKRERKTKNQHCWFSPLSTYLHLSTFSRHVFLILRLWAKLHHSENSDAFKTELTEVALCWYLHLSVIGPNITWLVQPWLVNPNQAVCRRTKAAFTCALHMAHCWFHWKGTSSERASWACSGQ